MSQLRTIKCDVCGRTYAEAEPGAGFPGWGMLHGVAFDDAPNPELCPAHLAAAADFLYKLRSQEKRA